MPLNQVGFQSKLSKARTSFEQKYERHPSIEELAEELGTDKAKIAEALGTGGKKISVDAPLQNDDSSAMIDTMTDETQAPTDIKMEQESLDSDLNAALSCLTDREQTVLKMLFGFGYPEMTAEEVAGKLNLTRERVRQIKERALRRLRENRDITMLKKYF